MMEPTSGQFEVAQLVDCIKQSIQAGPQPFWTNSVDERYKAREPRERSSKSLLPRIAIFCSRFANNSVQFAGIWRNTARHSDRMVRARRSTKTRRLHAGLLEFR